MKEEESIPSNLPRYWEIKQIPKVSKRSAPRLAE
jgi:hypothetical protein